MSGRQISVVIAGGGTGGHLTPGIAIAQEFLARNPDNRVLFIGSGRPLEAAMLSRTTFAYRSITTEGIKGRSLAGQFAAALKIPRGILESILILREFRPDLVIGVGGYAAGPAALAAWLMGIKIVLHEQNAHPGLTNRILARCAKRIYVSFESTRERLGPKKSLVTGNPVRSEFLSAREGDAVGEKGQSRPFRVYITGGSQGAHAINMAIIDGLEKIRRKDAYHFIHQTGPSDEQTVKEAYLRHGIPSTVKAFFDDAVMQYRAADLVICRAGATTVAETSILGKGVIFIPFPFSADNHQVVNARSLKDAGAADMILQEELSGPVLLDRIAYYAGKPDALRRMASRAQKLGEPEAATRIADDCYNLLCVGE